MEIKVDPHCGHDPFTAALPDGAKKIVDALQLGCGTKTHAFGIDEEGGVVFDSHAMIPDPHVYPNGTVAFGSVFMSWESGLELLRLTDGWHHPLPVGVFWLAGMIPRGLWWDHKLGTKKFQTIDGGVAFEMEYFAGGSEGDRRPDVIKRWPGMSEYGPLWFWNWMAGGSETEPHDAGRVRAAHYFPVLTEPIGD